MTKEFATPTLSVTVWGDHRSNVMYCVTTMRKWRKDIIRNIKRLRLYNTTSKFNVKSHFILIFHFHFTHASELGLIPTSGPTEYITTTHNLEPEPSNKL